MQPAGAQPAQWANRLGMVRRFALYCSAGDPRNIDAALPDLLPHRYRRPIPTSIGDEDIARLLDAANQLPSANGPLRSQTYSTVFGLYVATGLRCNLKRRGSIATTSILRMVC